MKITVTDTSRFRYFWAKIVTGFKPSVHCAQCLVGDYVREIGLKMGSGKIALPPLPEGAFLYVCGVSTPYKWADNFHAALAPGETSVSLSMHNGGEFAASGVRLVAFDDAKARALYPGKPEAFLTCRNFQFGAQMFK